MTRWLRRYRGVSSPVPRFTASVRSVPSTSEEEWQIRQLLITAQKRSRTNRTIVINTATDL